MAAADQQRKNWFFLSFSPTLPRLWLKMAVADQQSTNNRARHIPSAALRMANGRTGFGGPRRRPCHLVSVFLACFLWHGGVVAEKKKLQCACIAASSKDIQPSCFTDYDSEVGCSWEVDASTDCPKKFLLRVETIDQFSGRMYSLECSPKNKRGQNATPKCTCALQTKEVYRFMYLFSVEAKGKEIWKKSVDPDDIGTQTHDNGHAT